MKFSIIIPVFNTEKFVSRALDSILTQDYENFEIICIDDGSTDNSSKIIKEKAEINPCIKYYYQKNQGPGIARKNGFLKANGDLIYFMDSDDYLIDKSAFSKVVDIYNKYNPDVILFDIELISEKDAVIVKPFCGNELSVGNNFIDKLNDSYITANLLSKVFKRSLLEENMFIKENTFEDFYTMYLYLDKCNNYFYLDELLYCVDHSGENTNHISVVENVDKKKRRYNIISLTYSKVNNSALKKCIANYCSQVVIGEITLRTKHFFDLNMRKDNIKIKEELKLIIKILDETEYKYKPNGKFKLIKNIIFKLFLITHK